MPLTKHRTLITIITEDFTNSLYGGLFNSSEGNDLDPENPLVAGHVHDGQHLDGHAQKINLEDHVTGQLANDYIADNAITPRNITGFIDQSSAIPVSETIDGTVYYYIDTSTIGTADSVFATVSNVTSNSPGTLATDDFVFGSSSLDDDGDANHDSRFIFDKSNGSFRAGRVASTQWNSGNRGNFSVAFGANNTASGNHSGVLAGELNTASYNYSTAVGYQSITENTGENSFANGAFSTAGDNRAYEVIWRGTTNDNSTTELYIDGASERLTLNNHEMVFAKIIVAGIRTDAPGTAVGYVADLCVYRGAGAGTTTNVDGLIVDYDGGSACEVSISGNPITGTLMVFVVGITGQTFRWTAYGRIVKVKAT